MMGPGVIPRAMLRGQAPGRSDRAYLDRIAQEHGAVAAAVAASDEDGAREAMRAHLKGAQARYRRMIRETAPPPGCPDD